MSNWCLLRGFTALQRLRLRGRGSWRRGWNELQRLLLFFYRRSLKQILWHDAALQGSNPVFVQVQKNLEMTGTISTWSYYYSIVFYCVLLEWMAEKQDNKIEKDRWFNVFPPLRFQILFQTVNLKQRCSPPIVSADDQSTSSERERARTRRRWLGGGDETGREQSDCRGGDGGEQEKQKEGGDGRGRVWMEERRWAQRESNVSFRLSGG